MARHANPGRPAHERPREFTITGDPTGDPEQVPALRTLIGDYLAMRRALGFTLECDGRLLFAFADHLDRSGVGDDQSDGAATGEHVTVAQALRFATSPAGASTRSQALRLSAIRLLTRWAHPLDPRIEVPPPRLLPARATRPTPFLHTDAQLEALLDAADELRPPIRAATFRTMLSLQAATGIRTGEATRLDVSDVDLRDATLTVTGKYGKTRLGPGSIHPTFRVLTDRARLRAASTASRPRLHDLRHTFAVNTMLEAYR